MMTIFLLVIVLCFVPFHLCASSSPNGLHFEDNLLDVPFGPDNGYATVQITGLATQMSTCFRTFIEFARFGDQVGLMQFGDFLNLRGM